MRVYYKNNYSIFTEEKKFLICMSSVLIGCMWSYRKFGWRLFIQSFRVRSFWLISVWELLRADIRGFINMGRQGRREFRRIGTVRYSLTNRFFMCWRWRLFCRLFNFVNYCSIIYSILRIFILEQIFYMLMVLFILGCLVLCRLLCLEFCDERKQIRCESIIFNIFNIFCF